MGSLGSLLFLTLAALAPGPEPVSPGAISQLPPGVSAQLQQHLLGARSPQQRMQRVFDFVLGPSGLALQYGGDATLTAEQAAQARTANCLSFSLLFVALAREAGLDAYVQEVERVLVWHAEAGIVYSSGHANAGVRIGRQRFNIDINRSLVLAGTPPRVMSDTEAQARYYNNRGAELLARGEFVAARRHFALAQELSPNYLGTRNNLGVLAAREDNLESARFQFEAVLAGNPENSAALFNLINLHQRLGQADQANEYLQRLDRVRLRDPFHQFLLGHASERRGDFQTAATYYRRAIRLHGEEHRFHFSLARVYAQLGNATRARNELMRARDLADESERPLYQAKLEHLQASGTTLR